MLWIVLAVVVAGLIALAVLLMELRAKQRRLQEAIGAAQRQTAPAIELVRSLSDVTVPSVVPPKPQKTLVGDLPVHSRPR